MRVPATLPRGPAARPAALGHGGELAGPPAETPPARGNERAELRGARGSALILLGLGMVAGLSALLDLLVGQSEIAPGRVVSLLLSPDGSPDATVIESVRLPRAVAALACGAGFGVAGLLIQAVVKNPLAEPGTVGVSAGAGLAVAIASVAGLPLGVLGSVPVALAGGVLAAGLVLGVSGGLRADPVRLILAGVAVAFGCAAGSAALQVLFEQQAVGLYLWGTGTLEQPGWAPVRLLAPAIPLFAAAGFLLARDLDALELGDDAAAALGTRPGIARILAGGLAILLAALAVALAGPIAFVGLAAPHIARKLRLAGYRWLLVASALAGAALLPLADAVALALSGTQQLTAGVVCAVLGAPLLIAIARKTPVRAVPMIARKRVRRRGVRLSPAAGTAAALGICALALVGALGVGEVPLGPAEVASGLFGQGDSALIVQELRLPRALVAAAAGAALACCGLLLQGATRNPLAGPEMIGVTGGATLGGVIMLLVIGSSAEAVAVGAFVGGVAALVLVSALAPRGFPPAQVALIGVAVASASLALVDVVLLRSGNRWTEGVIYLAGSTYAEGWSDLLTLAAVLLPAVVVAWLAAVRLDVLGAGDEVARSLGIDPPRLRLGTLILASTLAAAAVATVGAVGFVGLLAPHAARLLVGPGHRRLLPVTLLLGAALLLSADLVGRSVLGGAREIPSGVVTALIGAPLLLVLLRRRA